ncbi:MAG: histidine kinase dimerization/phospho-acceptor domain-containing protein [Anaerovoracaceae bacterium]|nr:histidine kinase dimerization/phospho-acceptor domain-containing protein [Bacillota bacterium]MDY2671348.1 histidine kinase dimerization/phospho-acceptor domain-containing protein [Anaerovoracaceae bacterium]
MNKRIFAAIFTTAIIVLTLSLSLVLGSVYTYYSGQYSQELRTDIAYLSDGVEREGLPYLQRISDEEAANKVRITWIDTDGAVLFDNKADVSTMENHADRPEIKNAMKTGKGSGSRYSKTMSVETHYYAQKLDDGTVLRISVDHHTWLSNIMGNFTAVLAVILAAIAISAVVAYRVSHRIIDPLNSIDLENPMDTDVYEELQPLLRRLANQNEQIEKQVDDLSQQQREFTAITNNMTEGLIVINEKNDVLSCNTSALDILNAEKPEGRTNILELTRNSVVREAVETASEGKHCEQSMKLGNRVYSVISAPVYVNGGNGGSPEKEAIKGAVLVFIDTTEKEERDRLRREFAANVTHELKTPLTSVMGFAELMKSGLVKAEDTKVVAGKIYDEARRLLSLIDDILHLSRLEETDPEQKIEEVDLTQESLDVIQRLSTVAAKNSISVTYQGKDIKVQTIPQVLDEIIYNIVENAIKYNKPGGSVTIDAGIRDGRPFLSVADTGIGISDDEQERVFERFYRVDKSHSDVIEGTGLGLAIVKHGVRVIGAELEMESEKNVGTTMTILF